MFFGETIRSGAPSVCCTTALKNEVLSSYAGYYIGTCCPDCGSPYSRESLYYPHRITAQDALDNNNVTWRS